VRTLLRYLAAGLLLLASPVFGQAPGASRDTVLEARVRAVSSRLRCPVCQGLSLQDSPSELSQEMKAVVREQLAAGKSNDEVLQYFVGKYGEWILLEPTPRGFNLAVYALPVAMLLAGGLVVGFAVRRWTTASHDAATPADPAAPNDDLADALETEERTEAQDAS
jgi:cytochrome c-type biogenesis protein CcmH